MEDRLYLKNKKRIVIKIGSSSLIHEETGGLDYIKLEKLVRIISDLKNQDKDVVLVSSGAIGVGSKSLGLQKKPKTTSLRQACAAVGQGQLMMVYQRLFYEYHQIAAQVLLTFDVITSQERRHNAVNTFNELLQMDVIPVVNENDTVAIEEVDINSCLSPLPPPTPPCCKYLLRFLFASHALFVNTPVRTRLRLRHAPVFTGNVQLTTKYSQCTYSRGGVGGSRGDR